MTVEELKNRLETIKNIELVDIHIYKPHNAIYALANFKNNGLRLRIAYDLDDKESEDIVFNLHDGDNLLMTNVCPLDIIINHLNKHL